MSFSEQIKVEALTRSGRHCCICHRFVGSKIELHHIVLRSEGGEDTLDNCIPLCFDCHADMTSYDKKHPRGTKYGAQELKVHRDKWYDKVSNSKFSAMDKEKHNELDIQLYKYIRKKLPYRCINNIRTFHFANPMHRNQRDEIFDFAEEPVTPENEFIDPELESARGSLTVALSKLAEKIATNTWVMEESQFLVSVPREWEFKFPERYDSVISELHSHASEVVTAYDNLVRMAVFKFGIRITEHLEP